MKRALRKTYKDKPSTFQELLEKDNSVSIHHRNVQKLAIKNYKVLHGSPPILNDIFVPVLLPYNFRRNDTLQRQRLNSARHGTDSISFFGPKLWIVYQSYGKLTAQEWRRSFECFFDQWVNKCVCVCQFVHIDLRNSFGKDCISCSVTELTSISSMLLL